MKTTKNHYNLFKKECKKWEIRFELTGWDIDYYFDEYRPTSSLAKGNFDLIARSVSIVFNKEIGDDIEIDIKNTAKHEMIHVLLGVMSELAYSRFISRDELHASEEELVNKLEKIIK